ncbi:type II toxin-antitoxin system RelE/ParE family toxin [Thiomicrospira microaerophila]|uniref:type II toxin-antitoxin system RelE/ParE family toxin n=1 Tax=Thiomicrospira microaerophila TaxID=406020 RepID=UPI00200C2508|nr:type II toxin-antitoxin system RelE/ParE family toxin [Thiomicrospira microaerophila]UQB42143.1 type II toxin-antitoxin system RelE/ParE family toxin [Thiomicrospira microaerophila]
MKIEFKPKAQQDLSDIWDYTCQQWGTVQAETYIRNIWQTIESLKSSYNPSQNIDFVRAGYRKIQSGSHVIFFKQALDTITVIRILHQQMDITKHLP